VTKEVSPQEDFFLKSFDDSEFVIHRVTEPWSHRATLLAS